MGTECPPFGAGTPPLDRWRRPLLDPCLDLQPPRPGLFQSGVLSPREAVHRATWAATRNFVTRAGFVSGRSLPQNVVVVATEPQSLEVGAVKHAFIGAKHQ